MWVVAGIGLGLLLVIPSVRAADGDTAQAAVSDVTRDQVLQTIEATRQADPDLAAEMERQLDLMETGEEVEGPEKAAEHLREAISHLEDGGKTEQADKLTEVLGRLERGEITPEQCELEAREILGDEFEGFERGDLLVGPPVEGQTGEYLPPEARAQLEKLFQEQGTGDPAKDAHVREEAKRILKEYGIEHPDWEHEGEWEKGDWKEHMSPEAHEQMERLYEGEHHDEMEREAFERTSETPERMYEAPERTYEQYREHESYPHP